MFAHEEITERSERCRAVWEILNGETLEDSRLQEAQSLLDAVDPKERDAEWHYAQAAVNYHRLWYLDCKKHLRKAMKLDPGNETYKAAFRELTAMADAAKKSGNPIPGGWSDGCGEACAECCCQGICEGICNGF